MTKVTKIYLYEPTRPPLLLKPSKIADAPESGEQRDTGYGVTVAGVKCAKRIIAPSKWWDYYQKSTVNATCCTVKAEDICGGEFSFNDGLADNPRDELTELITNSQQDLVDAARDGESTGWADLECLPRVGGGLAALNHLPSHTCWIDIVAENVVHTYTQRKGSSTLYPLLGKGSAREMQCAWLNTNHYPYNTYYGVPDSWTVLTQIEAAYEGVKWNHNFFTKNGGYNWLMIMKSPPGQADATADAATLDIIDAHIKDSRGENADLLSIPIGNHEIVLHKLGADVKDMDFTSLLEIFRADIQSAHRVPASVLGRAVHGALGGQAVDSEHDNYLRRVIKPKQRRWTALINKIISVYYGVDAGFKWVGDEAVDLKELAVPVRDLYMAGLLRHGEAREMVGRDVDEEYSDAYYNDLNMYDAPIPEFDDNTS